ncbi:MAG: PAS domain S-box protein [Geminicoccaceae bacterium]
MNTQIHAEPVPPHASLRNALRGLPDAFANMSRPAAATTLGLIYLVTAAFGLAATQTTGAIAAFWPSSAIIVALLFRRPDWFNPLTLTACLLANIAAVLLVDAHLGEAIYSSFSNCLEIMAAICALRRIGDTAEDFLDLRNCLLAVGALALVSLVAAIFGATILAAASGQQWAHWAETSFIADFSSYILLVPPILFHGRSDVLSSRSGGGRRYFALVLLAIYFAGAFWLVFIDRSYTSIAAFGPAFIWLALSWGISATAAACALVAVASILQIIIDVGTSASILSYYLASHILEAQVTASLSVFAFIPLAIVVVQRAALNRDIEQERASAMAAARLNRLVLDTISDGVVSFDHGGDVITANKSARNLLAPAPDKAAAGPTGRACDLIVPDELIPTISELRGDGPAAERTLDIRSAAGALRLDARLEPLLDENERRIGVLAVLRDITQTHAAQERTRALESRFQTLYHSTPAVLHSIDADGRLLSVSDRWLDVFGYERDEVIGRPANEFLTNDSREIHTRAREELHETGVVHDVPYRFVRKDGVEIDMLLSATVERDPDGGIVRSLGVMNEVSELRRLQGRLTRSEALRTAVFDQVAEAIVTTNVDGTVLTFNQAALDVFGICSDEISGQPLSRFIRSPDTGSDLIEGWIASSDVTQHAAEELALLRCGDERRIHVDLSMSRIALDDATVLVFVGRDVSDRVMARIEIERAHQTLEDAIGSITDGFALFDENHRLSIFNASYRRMIDKCADLIVVGSRHEDIVRAGLERGQYGPCSNSDEAVASIIERHRAGDGPFEIEMHDGRWIRVVICETKSGGRVGIRSDITALKTMQRQLESRNSELQRANSDLQNFVRVASHDLKSPLRAIGLVVEWTREDIAEGNLEEVDENFQTIVGRIKRMQALLDDLLVYSRIGRDPNRAERLDVRDLAHDIAELLEQDGFAIEIAIDSSIRTIETQKSPLHTVLRNLVANALKHHDRETGHVRVSCRRTGKFAEFAVQDDGPGVDPDHHDAIFQLFTTLHSRDNTEGSGMGLAIVKKYVNLHGGEVWLDTPKTGRGTIFRFTWPIAA